MRLSVFTQAREAGDDSAAESRKDDANSSNTTAAEVLPALEFTRDDRLPRAIFACLYSDQHKFAFLFIPKNGGTAMMANLQLLLCVAAGKAPGCGLKLQHQGPLLPA